MFAMEDPLECIKRFLFFSSWLSVESSVLFIKHLLKLPLDIKYQATCVSTSNSSSFLALSTFLGSISLSPRRIVFQITSFCFSKSSRSQWSSSTHHKLSSTLIRSSNLPSSNTCPVVLTSTNTFVFVSFTFKFLAVTPSGRGIYTVRSECPWDQLYFSVESPL